MSKFSKAYWLSFLIVSLASVGIVSTLVAKLLQSFNVGMEGIVTFIVIFSGSLIYINFLIFIVIFLPLYYSCQRKFGVITIPILFIIVGELNLFGLDRMFDLGVLSVGGVHCFFIFIGLVMWLLFYGFYTHYQNKVA